MQKLHVLRLASLVCLILFLSFEFVTGQTDSILNNQVEATRIISNQIRILRKEVEKINTIEQIRTQNAIDSVVILRMEINDLEIKISEIGNKVIEFDSQKQVEEEGVLKRSIPDIIGAFIGAGSAMLVFFLSRRWERGKEIEREARELQEKNSYLGSLLQASIDLARKQNSGVKDFYEKIDANPLEIPLISIFPKQDLERLSKVIGNEEYFHAFLDKYGSEPENIKLYREISGSVDLLNSLLNQMFDIQGKGQKFDHERKIKYKDLFCMARDSSLELGQQEDPNSELHGFISATFLAYHNELIDSSDFKYHQEHLVEPLKEGFVQNFKAIREVRCIINDLKNATLIYYEITAQNKNHAEKFKGFYSQIDEEINFLEKKWSRVDQKF